MKINSIKVSGFRNIDNTTIEITDIVSLSSINSYGKSNFLQSIVFGFDFIHQPNDVKKSMMNFGPYKPYNTKIFFKDFSFEIKFSYEKKSKIMQVVYGYSFSWKKHEKDEPKILKEYLKIKDDNTQKFTTYISRNGAESLYKSSIKGSCNKEIQIEFNELLINKLSAYDDLYYLDLIKDINNARVYVDRHFNTNNAYGITPFIKKNTVDYNLSDNTNIPRMLYKIRNDYPNKYELIVNTTKDIFPFIADIQLKTYDIEDNDELNKRINDNYIHDNKIYLLTVDDKNLSRRVTINEMSDGVRRVLLILTTLVLADINGYSLVGIEEPENSLNPKILQRYLIVLKNFTKNTKIIITSHSPYLINYLKPQNIYIGLPNKNGIASFSKIKEKCVERLLKDAKNMDMLVGDYLFDLMSGDDEDLNTMIKYVE